MQFVVMRSLLCLLALLGVVLAAGSASAETKKKVQVVTIMSDDAYEQAQALTVALKSAFEKDTRWDASKRGLLAGSDGHCAELFDAAGRNLPRKDRDQDRHRALRLGIDEEGSGRRRGKAAFLGQPETPSRKRALRYSSNLKDAAEDKLLELARGALRELVGAPVGTLVVLAGKVERRSLGGWTPRGRAPRRTRAVAAARRGAPSGAARGRLQRRVVDGDHRFPRANRPS